MSNQGMECVPAAPSQHPPLHNSRRGASALAGPTICSLLEAWATRVPRSECWICRNKHGPSSLLIVSCQLVNMYPLVKCVCLNCVLSAHDHTTACNNCTGDSSAPKRLAIRNRTATSLTIYGKSSQIRTLSNVQTGESLGKLSMSDEYGRGGGARVMVAA